MARDIKATYESIEFVEKWRYILHLYACILYTIMYASIELHKLEKIIYFWNEHFSIRAQKYDL